MLSINVFDWHVILVGLVIRGCKAILYRWSIKLLVELFLSAGKWSILKSPHRYIVLFLLFLKGPFKCYVTLFFLKLDPHPPPVHQPGSDSQDGVWRDRQHRHWERSATRMYPLTTTIQYIRRKHNERGFGRMGEWNQHRREDGDEPEIRRRYNTARWDQGRIDRTCGKS